VSHDPLEIIMLICCSLSISYFYFNIEDSFAAFVEFDYLINRKKTQYIYLK